MSEEIKPKLGIIAGGGEIPRMLIEFCKKSGRDFYVVALKGNANKADITGDIPHSWYRLGHAAKILKAFKEQNAPEIVMIGTVRRPSFAELKPDFASLWLALKVMTKSFGDDGLLSAVVHELENRGFVVKGIDDIMPDFLAPHGILGKHKPDEQALKDIAKGVGVAKVLGAADVGQSVIIQQGLVLGVEAIEGTDNLIKRCKDLHRKGLGGVLVKLKKPEQERRVDLPTIGVSTVENAHASSLRGIAVHAGNALVVNHGALVKKADELGLFVIGINPDEF